MGMFDSIDHGDLTISPGINDGRLYKIIQLAAISVLVVSVTLVIFEIFKLFDMSSTANGIVISLGVIGVGGLTALPWVRVFEKMRDRRFKLTALAFVCVIGICVVLWITCVWRVITIVNSLNSEDESTLVSIIDSLNVIRIALIVSLQFVILSYIAMNIVKYRKSLLPYQILAAVCNIYIDFYFVLVLTAFTIDLDGFHLLESATILTNKWLFPLLIVFIVLMIFPNIVFRRTDKQKMIGAARVNKASAELSADIDAKLRQIQSLRDQGLITQAEYDKKRAEILRNI